MAKLYDDSGLPPSSTMAIRNINHWENVRVDCRLYAATGTGGDDYRKHYRRREREAEEMVEWFTAAARNVVPSLDARKLR